MMAASPSALDAGARLAQLLVAEVHGQIRDLEGVNARIYQKPKSATQSGRAGVGQWVLEFEPSERKRHDPVTGWIGSGDTQRQVRLSFPSLEAAIDYAKREEIAYTVHKGSERVLKLQAYADNFR